MIRTMKMVGIVGDDDDDDGDGGVDTDVDEGKRVTRTPVGKTD